MQTKADFEICVIANFRDTTLKLVGLAQVEFAFCSPAALFAYVLRIFDELFVLGEVFRENSHVFHITQMLAVFHMRHLKLLPVFGIPAHLNLLSLFCLA